MRSDQGRIACPTLVLFKLEGDLQGLVFCNGVIEPPSKLMPAAINGVRTVLKATQHVKWSVAFVALRACFGSYCSCL
jgi:hypothetical protein